MEPSYGQVQEEQEQVIATVDRVSVPGYEIVSELGRGGMGVVYQARHIKLDRLVALKVLSPKRMGDKESVARFNREMKAVGKLTAVAPNGHNPLVGKSGRTINTAKTVSCRKNHSYSPKFIST